MYCVPCGKHPRIYLSPVLSSSISPSIWRDTLEEAFCPPDSGQKVGEAAVGTKEPGNQLISPKKGPQVLHMSFVWGHTFNVGSYCLRKDEVSL